jgi:hypothetical protein
MSIKQASYSVLVVPDRLITGPGAMTAWHDDGLAR